MKKKGNVSHLIQDRYLYHSRPWSPSHHKKTNPYLGRVIRRLIRIIPWLAWLPVIRDYFLLIFARKMAFFGSTIYLQKFLFEGTNISMLSQNKCQTNWSLLSNMLCNLFSEALYLQRIPILPTILLGERQGNVSIKNLLNLEKSFLITPKGERIKLTWVHQNDYIKMHQISSYFKYTLSDYIDESTNMSAVLAIRHGRNGNDLSQGIKSIERILFIAQVQVHLEPVKRIAEAIENISNKMKDYYFLSCQNPFSFTNIGSINNLQDLVNEVGFFYPKKYNILKSLISGQGLLENIAKVYPKGSKIYIASRLPEEIKQELFTPLRHYYDIFEANDFLALNNLNTSQPLMSDMELEVLEEGIQKRSMRALNIRFLPKWDYPSDWEEIVMQSSRDLQNFSEGLIYR